MMNTNSLSEAQLSPEEQLRFQEELLLLLAKQTKRYTMGDSSSVPVELAKELLRSICFCLELPTDYTSERWRLLLASDIEVEFRSGIERVKEKMNHGKKLWQMISTNLPPIENTSMLDTLKSIGTFWNRYDYRYFAHNIPCDIDYQLALPVSDSLEGVDYVNRYLEHLAIENNFLSLFNRDRMIPVLNRYCPDYKGLLINIFEPVVTNAFGLAVLQKPVANLEISKQDLAELCSIFQEKMGIAEKLRYAVDSLTAGQGVSDSAYRTYLYNYSEQLAVRAAAMLDCGGMGGIFL